MACERGMQLLPAGSIEWHVRTTAVTAALDKAVAWVSIRGPIRSRVFDENTFKTASDLGLAGEFALRAALLGDTATLQHKCCLALMAGLTQYCNCGPVALSTNCSASGPLQQPAWKAAAWPATW